MKRIVILSHFLIITLFLFSSDPVEIISSYKKAKLIFLGKVIGIQELERSQNSELELFLQPILVEFEVELIYKGKRFEKLIIADTFDLNSKTSYEINKEFLVYLSKNKRDKNYRYNIVRSRKFDIEETKEENIVLLKHIKEHFFRKTKNPTPYIRFISGGCNCK